MAKAHTNGTDVLAQAIADLVATRLQESGPVKQRLLDSKEAAKYLGVSEHTLRHWTAAGDIPVTRIDAKLRFDVLELDRWIKENTKTE
jgi:excisionase family DNA binding protein